MNNNFNHIENKQIDNHPEINSNDYSQNRQASAKIQPAIKRLQEIIQTVSLRTKFLIATSGLILLLGILIINITQNTLTNHLETEFENKGKYIAHYIAAESISLISTGNFIDMKLLLNERKKKDEDIEYIFILDGKNKILAHTFRESFPAELIESNPLVKGQSYSLKHVDMDKRTYDDIAVPIFNGDIGVVRLGLSEQSIMNSIDHIVRIIMAIILGGLISGGAITVFIFTRVTRPIRELTRGVEKIGCGELGYRVNVGRNDEIGHLAASFNNMVENLEKSKDNLMEMNMSLELQITERKQIEEILLQNKNDWEDTFNTITDMITIHDSEFNIIHANRAAAEILKLPLPELTKAKCFRYYHGTESPPQQCSSCDSLKTGLPVAFEVFEPYLNKYIEIRAMPRIDKNNELVGLIHVVRDISDKKKNEDKIKKQFSYINSLHTIDKAISSSLDLSITLNILLEQVLNQLRIDAASVLLFNPHSHSLEYAAGKGFRTDIIKSSSLRLGKGYAGRAAIERKPLVINDFMKPPDGILSTSLIKAEGFMAYIATPLIAKGEVKGVLEIYHRSAREHDPEWMDFLKTLAGQAAIAIDNANMVEDLHHTYEDLIMAYESTIDGWSRALDFRDNETEGHSQRVTELTLKLSSRMGIKNEELMHIRRGALLHDIGKLGVPDGVLLKPGKLTEEEWVLMKRHPVIAYEILSPISFLRPALDIPYYHHEKWDGTGYPTGLKGEQIPISARIFALVDIFDALISDRPYRGAWQLDKVLEYIRSISGTHLDPKVVDEFFSIM
jgi:HD-GYP domain-containing protein (c-di-GMP phosphodiesterase class II)/PAS domain-containing protein